MVEVTSAEFVFRLVVTLVAIVGPTLLYLGLWRFLMWLRDDELVERLVERGVIEDPQPAAVDVLATATGEFDGRRCSNCGTANLPSEPICRNCFRDLK